MKIFDREKRGQGATEYLLMLAAVLVVVAVAVTMLTDLAPDFEVTGQPTVTDYDGDEVTVNLAGLSVAPSDALIEEISIVVDGSERNLAGPFEDEDREQLDELENSIYSTTTGTSDRDNIGDIIIEADVGTATITPVFQ